MRAVWLSTLALFAFAGNSILCRLALADAHIDPAGFTSIRLASGAIMLLLIVVFRSQGSSTPAASHGSWLAAFALFIYAAGFSFAYVSLDTATGALILFGLVQLTMVASSVLSGQRPRTLQWLGLLMAMGGLSYLLLPDADRPSLFGAFLMAIAGIAWAIYTLLGRSATDSLRATAINFSRSLPLALLLLVVYWDALAITPWGALLAVASGALTSALGYAVWYAALPFLSTLNAAVVQLLVPIIAAVGGVVFSDESISLRLALASGLVLLGIITVIFSAPRINTSKINAPKEEGV